MRMRWSGSIGLCAALIAVGALIGSAWVRPASAAGAMEGVQCSVSVGAIGFFDSQTGDLWHYEGQRDGTFRLEHFLVSQRGKSLVKQDK